MENKNTGVVQQGSVPAEWGDAAASNYRNGRADNWMPFDADSADKKGMVVSLLQATVVELLELYHDAKQAHWNLHGPLYFPLYEKLDEYATVYLGFTDRVAERALQIGSPIDGRTDVVAETANLGKLPGGYLTDRYVLDLMTERIYTVAVRVRKRINELGGVDETTANLLQELSYTLDKQVWQFRSHML